MEEKIKSLEIAEHSAKQNRELLIKCENDYKKKVKDLENKLTFEIGVNQELNKLMTKKDQFITDLQNTIQRLKKSKNKLEEELKVSQNQVSEWEKFWEKNKKWAKWGAIGAAVLVIGWWGYKKIRGRFSLT